MIHSLRPARWQKASVDLSGLQDPKGLVATLMRSRRCKTGTSRNNLISSFMKREFNVVIERDSEGYFVASVPSLRGCHTQAMSLDVLMERIREAIEVCLEVEQDEVEL